MVIITAEEKTQIQEAYPNIYIVRTMRRDSKRHHYYMPEESKLMLFLKGLRAKKYENTGEGVIDHRDWESCE